MRDPIRSGPWLVATAAAASLASGLVVASATLHLDVAHRALAVLALPPMIALALAAQLEHRRLRPAAFSALALFVLASLLGAAVSDGAGTVTVATHVAIAACTLAACVVCLTTALRGKHVPAAPWRDYVTLTKPRIMTLLLLTGACGMVIARHGAPPAGRFAAAMTGLALACGGASAFNHLLDADLDRQMQRTRSRPVASGRLAPARALEFGLALSAASFVLLAAAVNLAAALLALAGNLFYVMVYTRWLKRSTAQNIVIGGAAGAVPPLVGWAAATGRLDMSAGLLFLIVFLWTPPHFWALAMLIRRDYQEAGVPMLPVVRGDRFVTDRILAYSVVLVAATLLPAVVSAWGPLYTISATLLGAWFVLLAWRLRRQPVTARAGALFHFSLLYLALLFVAAAASSALG